MKEKRSKRHLKDIILFIIYVAVFIGLVVIPESFAVKTASDIPAALLQVFGTAGFYIYCIKGINGFFLENNHTALVPNSFLTKKNNDFKETVQELIFEVIDEQSNNIAEHDLEKLRKDVYEIFGNISAQNVSKMAVISARKAGLADISDARKRLEGFLFRSDIICDMRRTSDSNTFSGLNYYIRFFDLMQNEENVKAIASLMVTFISHALNPGGNFSKDKLDMIDVIVTPNSGNYLLGYMVSKELKKVHIKMIPTSKIVGDNYYEGIIPKKSGSKEIHMILVHDVLATGRQIIESITDIKKCHPDCKIDGVFSLIYRENGHAADKIKALGVEAYNLTEYSEDDIERRLLEMQAKKGGKPGRLLKKAH